MPDSLCFCMPQKGFLCLHKDNAILRIFAALSMGEFVKDKYRKDARGAAKRNEKRAAKRMQMGRRYFLLRAKAPELRPPDGRGAGRRKGTE